MGNDNDEFEEQFKLQKLEKFNNETRYPGPEGLAKDYEWDDEKKAWFPKIEADVIVNYQLAYGCDDTKGHDTASEVINSTNATWPDPSDPNYTEWYNNWCRENMANIDPNAPGYAEWYFQHFGAKPESSQDSKSAKHHSEMTEEYFSQYLKEQAYGENDREDIIGDGNVVSEKGSDCDIQKGKGKAKEEKKKEWFELDEQHNTSVYVSGLPTDITPPEFEELMAKYGLIALDPRTGKLKLKLYQDSDGSYKGDGRCTYIKAESVDLALQFFDESILRGCKVRVELAKFELKGNFDPNKNKRRRLTNKEKRKMKEKQERLFAWIPDKLRGQRDKHEKVVVLRNLFTPESFDENPILLQKLQERVREECMRHGEVRRVVVHDRHLEGISQVTMSDVTEADLVISALNGRLFCGRQVTAENWDGKSKFEVEESVEEKAQRLKKWEDFIAGEIPASEIP